MFTIIFEFKNLNCNFLKVQYYCSNFIKSLDAFSGMNTLFYFKKNQKLHVLKKLQTFSDFLRTGYRLLTYIQEIVDARSKCYASLISENLALLNEKYKPKLADEEGLAFTFSFQFNDEYFTKGVGKHLTDLNFNVMSSVIEDDIELAANFFNNENEINLLK